MSARAFLFWGLSLMLLGVVLGAFGAHAIRASVSAQQMTVWQTASEYHFIHALGLIGLALWLQGRQPGIWAKLSGLSLLAGILIFSGSLYLMVLTGNTRLGMITPIGGVLMMLGWLAWMLALWQRGSPKPG